jgi:predicted chitinase
MSKKLDDKILLHAKPIVSKEEFINNFKNITLEIKLLRDNKEPIKDISFKAENIKVEKVSNNIELLKKYNLIYENKYIIKYEFTAREIATKLELTDEEIKDVSFVSGWIDANCDGKFSKNYEKWVEITICRGITKEMLVAMECIEASNNQELIDALNKYCCQHEINTPLRVAHFLAQVAHESGCFRIFGEGIYYRLSTALATWPSRNNDINRLSLDGRYLKQPDLFNAVYGTRNGNSIGTNDGYNFRGRGLIQLTGRTNYTNYQASHNAKNPDDIQDFINNPDLIASNINYAVESACWYWDSNQLNLLADKNTTDVTSVTKKVNGGTNGLTERQEFFDAVKKVLGI